MTGPAPIVVVGGGVAALSAVRKIRRDIPGLSIVMISEERVAPYDRTTLSKAHVLSPEGHDPPAMWNSADPLLGVPVARVGVNNRFERLPPEHVLLDQFLHDPPVIG